MLPLGLLILLLGGGSSHTATSNLNASQIDKAHKKESKSPNNKNTKEQGIIEESGEIWHPPLKEYRYLLSPKDYGNNPLVVFGINPSTATLDRDGNLILDPTLKAIYRIATKYNYNGFIMFNLYPQRATDPEELHKTIDTEAHNENLRYIRETLLKLQLQQKGISILCAWGNNIEKRPYLTSTCLKDIHNLLLKEFNSKKEFHPKYLCIDKTKEEHPHHPLRITLPEKLKEFAMDGYVMKELSMKHKKGG